jgi:hypothetical protein
MIFTNLILYSVRKLSGKFWFLARWFSRRTFLNEPTQFLHFFWDYLNLPLKWTWQIWIIPACSGEEDFLKFSVFFLTFFAIISPWRRIFHFIWRSNPESPSPKYDFCHFSDVDNENPWDYRKLSFYRKGVCVLTTSGTLEKSWRNDPPVEDKYETHSTIFNI